MSAIPLIFRPYCAESKTAQTALLVLSLAAISPMQAAPIVWNGEGATPNWSDTENWQGNASPQNTDELHFAGTNQLTNTNDIDSLTAGGVIFDANAGSFTLQGNQLHTLGDIINNSSATQTIDLDLLVTGNRSWVNNGQGSGAILDINGEISMSEGNGIEIAGNGDTRIDGIIRGGYPAEGGFGSLRKYDEGNLLLNGNTSLAGLTTNGSGNVELAAIHLFPDTAFIGGNDSSSINLSGIGSFAYDIVQMNDSSSFNITNELQGGFGIFTVTEDASINVAGNFSGTESTFEFSDSADLKVSGDFYASLSTLTASGDSTIDVSGNMELAFQTFVYLEDNARMDVSGSVSSSGGSAIFMGTDSTLNLTGAGTTDLEFLENLGIFSAANKTESYSFDADLANHGLVVGGSGSHFLELTGDVWGYGNFEGNILFNGSYSPGEVVTDPTLVSQQYSLFGSNSLLMMQLGGLERGVSYDAIDALTLDLAGILEIDLIDFGDPFTPIAGNSFDLLRAGAISGNFSAFNFTDAVLMSGLAWSANIVREGDFDIFRLSVIPGTTVPEPGTLLLLFMSLTALVLREKSLRPMAPN